ncbi:hypothetical protein F5882DRAFT_300188, partial [Hyaloscypha sp. PMI_1271]
RNKEDAYTLFSITYFVTLFRYTYDYFSQTSKGLFDFIKVSRKYNPITKDLAKYLSIFLKYIKLVKELTEFIVPIIASSILLDNYPLDTYIFKPKDMFRTLYRDVFY